MIYDITYHSKGRNIFGTVMVPGCPVMKLFCSVMCLCSSEVEFNCPVIRLYCSVVSLCSSEVEFGYPVVSLSNSVMRLSHSVMCLYSSEVELGCPVMGFDRPETSPGGLIKSARAACSAASHEKSRRNSVKLFKKNLTFGKKGIPLL